MMNDMPDQTLTRESSATRLSARELGAWRGLLRVHAQLSKGLEAQMEAAHGLPLSSYEVLMYLADADGRRMRMCDLADSVILSRSGLTRLVDRLEREGLLTREPAPDDARGSFAKLTDTGVARLQEARVTHLAGVRELFLGHLSDEEQDLLASLWERILPDALDPGAACGSDQPET
jgi:DNA-binding MarR family transcriptional regulator